MSFNLAFAPLNMPNFFILSHSSFRDFVLTHLHWPKYMYKIDVNQDNNNLNHYISNTTRKESSFLPYVQKWHTLMYLFYIPSMFSIIFHCDGRTLWWKPNQTSRPPPSDCIIRSGGEKNERPTGVKRRLGKCLKITSNASTVSFGITRQRPSNASCKL